MRTRTIYEIHILRNKKKIVKKLGTKIKDTFLRLGTKMGTFSKLQVRNKNERTRIVIT